MLGLHTHLNGVPLAGPLLVVFGPSLPSSSKKVVKVRPPLTKLFGSAHASYGMIHALIKLENDVAQYAYISMCLDIDEAHSSTRQ